MIPEVYWRLLGRWWWLIGLCALVAGGAAYLFAQSAVTYKSEAALEITRVYSADGVVSYDELERRARASQYSEELQGAWVEERLAVQLGLEGIDTAGTDPSVQVAGPTVSKNRVEAPIITIALQHPNKGDVQRMTEIASQVYAQYVRERQAQILTERRAEVTAQVQAAEAALQKLLEEERLARGEEQARTQEALRALLAANSNLVALLSVSMDDFARKTAPATGPDAEALNTAASKLRADIERLETEWQSKLQPSLTALYGTVIPADIDLLLSRVKQSRAAYEESLKKLATLSERDVASVAALLEDGTKPRRISTIGFGSKYVAMAGAAAGLAIGWVLANLGEYLLQNRRRATRRIGGPVGADQPSEALQGFEA